MDRFDGLRGSCALKDAYHFGFSAGIYGFEGLVRFHPFCAYDQTVLSTQLRLNQRQCLHLALPVRFLAEIHYWFVLEFAWHGMPPFAAIVAKN